MSSDATIGRVARHTVLLLAVWTVPVILGSAGHFFGDMMLTRGGPSMPRVHIYGHSLSMWYPWIPATPIIFWLSRNVRLRGAGWLTAPLAHLGTLTAVFLAQVWLTLVVGHWTGHVSPEITWRLQFTFQVVNLLLYDMLIHGGVVAVAFGIDYARRYRDRDLRASQLETQLERARLETLQMQLQPHFLFNALNSIAMLVRRDRRQEAVDVIVGFGELLRYVLDESGTMDVRLDEELRFVRRYLDIERVRLGDRLDATITVAAGVEGAVVPNLILQPLVENALKHGIVVRPEGGRLRIVAERRGDLLRIEVEDDGPGLPPGWSLDSATGFGLRNLRDRVAVFYGGAGQFAIVNLPTGGVKAIVEIPFRLERARNAPMARAG